MIRTSCAGMVRFWQVGVAGTVRLVPGPSGPVSGDEGGDEGAGARAGDLVGPGRGGRGGLPQADLPDGEGPADDEALLRLLERLRVRVVDEPLAVAGLRGQVALALGDLAAGALRGAHVRHRTALAAVGEVRVDPFPVREAV